MLAVTGFGSAIVGELAGLVAPTEKVVRVDAKDYRSHLEAERWVLAAGVLTPKRSSEQTLGEIADGMAVNYVQPVEICEAVLAANPKARICVIGSESGCSGSYDDVYAAAKAALHAYVCRRRLTSPLQQLVAVAPSIIGDAGMTLRRADFENLERRKDEHPKRRFLRAVEVARMIHFLLYVDLGYTTGTVVRMYGGTA